MAATKNDWRKEGQKEELRPIMKWVGTTLNTAGFACFFCGLCFGRLSLFWSVICFVIPSISLAFYLLYPHYFTLMGEKLFRKRVGNKTRISHIDMALIFPALTILIRSFMDFQFQNYSLLLCYSILGGLIIAGAIYFFSKEIRENPDLMFGTILISILVSGGIVMQTNHHLDLEPENAKLYSIIDLDYHNTGRRNIDRYFCTVMKDDGTEIRVPVGRKTYYDWELGDRVLVYSGTGALGIEYAYFAGMPD